MSSNTQRDLFARNLERILSAKGWTRPHLLAAMHDAGVPLGTRTVDLWLAGITMPRSDFLVAIAQVLETTPNELLGFEATEPACTENSQ